MEEETGQSTQYLIEVIYRALSTRKLSGSVRLDVEVQWLIGFLEEHGLDVPEENRPDPEQRWKNKGYGFSPPSRSARRTKGKTK